MREAIHALKYDRLHTIAHGLGGMLAEGIAQLAGEAPTEMLVVPVPLHRSKVAQRGFNQARSLAQEAIGFLRKSHPEWRLKLAASTLMRLRATESQAGLTPRQRRQNLRGAFSVSDPAQVSARHILLIDDILTTGATARAAAQTLVEAGAASVWVATLARAQRAFGFDRGHVSQNVEEEGGSGAAGPIHAASFASASPISVSGGSSSLHDQPSF
jgi:ComF family protein